MGQNAYLNSDCKLVCHEKIQIGDNTIFGPNVLIYDHDHCFDYNGIKEGFRTASVVIGPNCWLGANVVVLKGSKIGEGCIVGAGTIVHGTISSHSIVTSDRTLVVRPILDDPKEPNHDSLREN